jgi:hypothetical protein
LLYLFSISQWIKIIQSIWTILFFRQICQNYFKAFLP